MNGPSTCAEDVPRRRLPPLWTPLIILAVGSLVIRLTDLDRSWAGLWWTPEAGWRLADHPLVRFLYAYGTWPATVVGVGSLVLWPWLWWRRVDPWKRRAALFLGLTLVLGPGVLVNAVFKDHYGRPRPRQTIEFGGDLPYRPLFEPGPSGEGKSFPSGHAAMGFYWLAFSVLYWNRNRRRAWGFGILGLGHGLLMGWGRTVQGGHWVGDVLWSAGMVYLSAWLLYVWLIAPLEQAGPVQAGDRSASSQ